MFEGAVVVSSTDHDDHTLRRNNPFLSATSSFCIDQIQLNLEMSFVEVISSTPLITR